VAVFDSVTGRMGAAAERVGKTTHATALIEMALQQAGFERSDIACLAIGRGPGSYTGIRAAIALAQGWQLARDIHLLGIGSVACLATQAQAQGRRGRIHIAIDAQRHEFYLATYEVGTESVEQIMPLRLAAFDEVAQLAQSGAMLIGPEVDRWFPQARVMFPEAATLACLAATRSDFAPGEKLEPIYLRETTFVKAPPPRTNL
jgi:tRNA threonylcarbamoyl adenosine modification protein YeaZ